MCLSKTGLQAFSLVLNVLLFICGGALMGLGIWMVKDKIFISGVVGSSTFSAACYMMLTAGVFLIILSFVGCFGAIRSKRIIIILYAVTLVVLFIIILMVGVLAAVFQKEIGSSMQENMRRTIKEQYGWQTDSNSENNHVTESWDILQARLECCGVDDRGWDIYKMSRWYDADLQRPYQYDPYSPYNRNPTLYETGIQRNNRPQVPASCCVYVQTVGQYLKLEQCQSWAFGPPGSPTGATNDALFYKGCYTAAKEFILNQTEVVLAIGFSFTVFVVAAVVVSILLLRKLSGRNMEFRS